MIIHRAMAMGMVLFFVVTAGNGFSADVVRLSPEKVEALAKTQSVAVKVSQYNVKAQEYAVKAAFTGFLPTLSANASAMHLFDKPQMDLGSGSSPMTVSPDEISNMNAGDWQTLALLTKSLQGMKIETPYNIYNVGLNIAQPVFTGGKILNGYRAVKFGLEAQKYSSERIVTEIGLSAQKLFWGYVGLLKGLDAVRETRQWFETLLKDQQKMYDNGLIIELDILNSRIQLSNFKLTEEIYQNSIRTMADQLLLLISLPQGTLIDPDTTMLAEPVPAIAAPATDSADQLLVKRDDLRAMASQIKALQSLKKLQLGSFWPTVAAIGSYGANNQSSTKESDMKLSSSIGVQLSWTLLDWGKAWREAQKIQWQTQAAQLQADYMREQVRLKYLELSRKIDESIKACDISREDLETARKALVIAKLKYDAQAITNTELLYARNQLTSKMVAYTQARITMILAVEEFRVAPLAGGSSPQM